MKNKEIWAVAVDFTKMDVSVLEYTNFLSSVLQPDKIHFIHILKEMKTAPYLPHEYLENFENQIVTEKKLELEHKVEKYFIKSGVSYEYHVESGTPFEEILNIVTGKSIKLVIAGRKKASRGSGVVSDQLASTLPCDFL